MVYGADRLERKVESCETRDVTAQAISNYFVQDFERDRSGFLITG